MKYFLSLLLFLIVFALPSAAQSGRVKQKDKEEEEKKTPKAVYVPTQTATPKPTQTPPPLNERPRVIDDDETIEIDSTLVPIPVSAIDQRTSRSIENLVLSDFSLTVDGKTAQIGDLFRSETPVRLALLFDNSSSVTVAREFEQKAAIRFFKRVVRPQLDLAALFSVAATTHLEQPLTKDVDLLVDAIRRFPPPEGATALHDGLVEAAEYLRDYPGRRVIVIVSDGQDTLSDTTFDNMVVAVQKANCQVYVVHTNEFENIKRTGARSGNANLRALAAERRMKSLTEQTGGAVYSPVDEDELDNAFRQISAELASQYILGYYPEKESGTGIYRQIEVKLVSRPDVFLRFRSGYYSGAK
ncbi:MAG: VWA domain-containing protein [Pyrinomonadaceae bacterium]